MVRFFLAGKENFLDRIVFLGGRGRGHTSGFLCAVRCTFRSRSVIFFLSFGIFSFLIPARFPVLPAIPAAASVLRFCGLCRGAAAGPGPLF